MMPNKQDQIKLINARIVDVENGCYYPPQVSLVIQNGKIMAIPGLAGEPDNIQTDAVYDLQGMTVIPGLFNTHCHLQFLQQDELGQKQIAKNLHDCIDRGVTNVRDTLCYDLQLNRNWMERIKNSDVRGPRIHQAVHVSPLGGTYAPHPSIKTRFSFSLIGLKLIDYKLPISGVVVFKPGASLQDVRDAVDRAVDERGAEAIKFCDQPEHFMNYKPGAQVMSAEQLSAAVDQAAERGMPTTMHNVTVSGFRQGIKAGIGSLAHLPLDGELDEADVTLLQYSNTHLEPTLSVGYFMSYNIKGSPFSGHPELQRLDQFREQTYRPMVAETWLPDLLPSRLAVNDALKKGELKVYGIMDISEPFRYYARIIPTGGQNLRLLLKRGAAFRLGCGNDAGATNCSAADIRYELEMLDFMLNPEEKPAITTADLLRTATIQSARSMAVDAQFGSIQTGKIADLVVLDGDPLQDFHLIGKPVQALFMDGKLVINRCGLEAQSSSGYEKIPLTSPGSDNF
jgi:imidazolonepropionase-like amidohydrolase